MMYVVSLIIIDDYGYSLENYGFKTYEEAEEKAESIITDIENDSYFARIDRGTNVYATFENGDTSGFIEITNVIEEPVRVSTNEKPIESNLEF